METRRTFLGVSTGLAAAAFGVPSALAQSRPRGVVELFTSQGCSSCPPADKLLTQMTQESGLITLTMPVDYWDYLGWKDTLASPHFSKRQKVYAHLRGDRQVYTPQAVINGAAHCNGAERAAIERNLKATAGDAGLALGVSIAAADGGFRIECDAGTAMLTAVPFLRSREVKIGRGENSGRSITYSNVAMGLIPVGEAGSQRSTHKLEANRLPAGAEGIVVLAQTMTKGHPGKILGAARLMFAQPPA
jgi:hypothetical protein